MPGCLYITLLLLDTGLITPILQGSDASNGATMCNQHSDVAKKDPQMICWRNNISANEGLLVPNVIRSFGLAARVVEWRGALFKKTAQANTFISGFLT